MTVMESFAPEIATIQREELRSSTWSRTGRTAYRKTFFGRLLRTVEEVKMHEIVQPGRRPTQCPEYRWRDVNNSDLVSEAIDRTESDIATEIGHLIGKRNAQFPSAESAYAFDQLDDAQKQQLRNIAAANGAARAEETLAQMVPEPTGAKAADAHAIEHLPKVEEKAAA